MADNGSGYMMTSDAERIEALQGQVRALHTTIIQMMRVISRGQTGEEAYQALARGLNADAESMHSEHNLMLKAASTDLKFLAGVFGAPPQN